MPAPITTRLHDRAVIRIAGADAPAFLQGLVSNDITGTGTGDGVFAGLLSPQGKILFDFFIVPVDGGYLLDTDAAQAGELIKRLTLYRLRAAVTIDDMGDEFAVGVAWDSDSESKATAATTQDAIKFRDPRHPELGLRLLRRATYNDETRKADIGVNDTDYEAYHCHRIRVGIPEGGKDYAFGAAYPHEALYDQIHGVSFTKGCFVGQEVVSRMQHRGAARKRIIHVSSDAPLPSSGSEITAGAATLGQLGSTCGNNGLALIRIDRFVELQSKGETPYAGDVPLRVQKQDWATFDLS